MVTNSNLAGKHTPTPRPGLETSDTKPEVIMSVVILFTSYNISN